MAGEDCGISDCGDLPLRKRGRAAAFGLVFFAKCLQDALVGGLGEEETQLVVRCRLEDEEC